MPLLLNFSFRSPTIPTGIEHFIFTRYPYTLRNHILHNESVCRAQDASHWRIPAAHWIVRAHYLSWHGLDSQISSLADTYFLSRFINNEWVEGVDKKTFEVINPSTEEVIVSVAEATEKDVDIAVSAARKAFEGEWRKVLPAERALLLSKLADLAEKNAELLAAVESLDNGKSITMAKGDVGAVIACLRYYSGWADKITGKTIDTNPDTFTYTRPEPVS